MFKLWDRPVNQESQYSLVSSEFIIFCGPVWGERVLNGVATQTLIYGSYVKSTAL